MDEAPMAPGVVGYRSGQCRNDENALSHTYAMMDDGELWPMCGYGWNRSNGERFSIFRGSPGTEGDCCVCARNVAGAKAPIIDGFPPQDAVALMGDDHDDAAGWDLTPQQERELAASMRAYDREQRWAALRMLWGRPIIDARATRRRTDGVIVYERRRCADWTLWRALVATVALVLNRRHLASGYAPSVDLGFWDSRSDGYGYSYGYLNLYRGWRVEVGSDGEMTW